MANEKNVRDDQPKLDSSPGLSLELPPDSALVAGMEIPELGVLEELTDAVIVLFQDVESQLNAYLVSYDEAEKDTLHKKMSRFLARINTNRLIPLGFRLKALRSFSRETHLLDEDLITAILTSYKLAISLVLESAQGRENYLLELGNLCGEAIHIAMEVVRCQLERYWEPHIQITRQVHEMTRIGLAALAAVPSITTRRSKAEGYLARIHRSISWYEMMRLADFYQLTVAEQRLVLLSLEPYVVNITPIYLPAGSPFVAQPKSVYIVSQVGGRQIKPEFCETIELINDKDLIILDVTALLPILHGQLETARRYIAGVETNSHLGHFGSDGLRTVDEIERTIQVANHLLKCMSVVAREEPRAPLQPDQQVRIIINLDAAIKLPAKVTLEEMAEDSEMEIGTWTINDLSDSGVGLVTANPPEKMPDVSALVRLVWPLPDAPFATWGKVAWRRHTLKGRKVFLGLTFLPRKVGHYLVQNIGTSERTPVLGMLLKTERQMLIWSNDQRYREGASLIINIGEEFHVCKVLTVVDSGANFKACRIELTRKFF